jgi:hypothetical protein
MESHHPGKDDSLPPPAGPAAFAPEAEPDDDWAPLPEQESPLQAADTDSVLLSLQLLDTAGAAVGNLGCQVRGPLSQAAFAATVGELPIDLTLHSGSDGVLLLDGVPVGAYALTAAGTTFLVHTISPRDLDRDADPYRLTIVEAR